MKKIIKLITSRLFIITFSILIQIILLFSIIWNLSTYFIYFYIVFAILSITNLLFIINNNSNPSTKLPWIVLILILPIFGTMFYMIFGKYKYNKTDIVKIKESENKFLKNSDLDNTLIKEIEKENKRISNQCKYILDYSFIPPFKNTETTYFPLGEIKFENMLIELEKAENFIFLEYFIIEEGKMWNSILEILEKKAKQGLDVRVIFDDLGCINTLPYKYDKKLENMGIKCVVFNPFTPSVSVNMNYRDHRKITIIDGKVAFNGGVNLADEYINEYEKYGHWKDSAIMIKGEAVWGFTLMFLQNWNFYRNEDVNFKEFKVKTNNKSDGYIQPFMDTPMDTELLSENIYMNIINTACDYVYIYTPYLIVDNELVTSLSIAAKRGVDIRIITPHIPDKKPVHLITRAYYPILIESGVKIYEYTPGFIHSKMFVSDDIVGVIGTVNLDYRSLYHHFECGTFIYKSKCLNDLKEDFLETLKVCTTIHPNSFENVSFPIKLARAILRIFAPLM